MKMLQNINKLQSICWSIVESFDLLEIKFGSNYESKNSQWISYSYQHHLAHLVAIFNFEAYFEEM